MTWVSFYEELQGSKKNDFSKQELFSIYIKTVTSSHASFERFISNQISLNFLKKNKETKKFLFNKTEYLNFKKASGLP